MANPKRASMREGPLAALFRKTEGEDSEVGATGATPRDGSAPSRDATSSRNAASSSDAASGRDSAPSRNAHRAATRAEP